jgi:O-antigen/teichoic acid export membrane protein
MTDELNKVAQESAKGGFFLITGSLFSTVIGAIGSIIAARILGADLYGLYVLSLVTPQLIFLFTDLGINQGLTKFAASLRAKGQVVQVAKIVKYGMVTKAIIGFALFLVTFALADFLAVALHNRPELGIYIRIASFSILFQVILATSSSVYVGLDKTEYSALADNIQATSKAVITVALVLAGFSVFGTVVGVVLSYVIGGVISLIILISMLEKYTSQGNDNLTFTQSIKTLTTYGIPLYISALFSGFVLPYQNLILGLFTTNTVIGNYQAAVNFITLITFISVPITIILLPAFSKLDSSTGDKVRTFFLFANKYTTLLIVPIATLLMTFSNEIVYVIYGSTYDSAAHLLSVYCIIYLLVGLGYLTLSSMFNGLGETRTTFKISLITFLLLVPLSPFFASILGGVGVIMASIIANMCGTFYGMYVAKRNFKIRFDTKSILKIYIIAAISTSPAIALLQLSPLPKLVNVLAGGIVYLATYLTLTPLTRIIGKSELKTISQITHKIKPLSPVLKLLLKYEEKILNLQR